MERSGRSLPVRTKKGDTRETRKTQHVQESNTACDHSKLCDPCETIERCLGDSLSQEDPNSLEFIENKGAIYSMGTVRNIRGRLCTECSRPRQCPLCRKLSEILGLESRDISAHAYVSFRVDEGSRQRDHINTWNADERTTRSFSQSTVAFRPRLYKYYVDSPLLQHKELFLTAVPPAHSSRESGTEPALIQLIQPDCIDINFARHCLETCQNKHGEICQRVDPAVVQWKPQIYLLDLQDRCLVRSTVDTDYVALSYVWGQQIETFECKMENLERFQEPGSIDDPEFFRIPALIESAIEFTVKMGKRYLWIDRCCIVQDDGRHKHGQIMAMGIIYAQACFTIVSSDGDARSKLLSPGSFSGSAHSGREPNIFHQTRDCQILYGLRYNSVPSDGPWASRGWTFQEQMFSRRLAIFVNGKLVWKCRTSIRQEEFRNELLIRNLNPNITFDTLTLPGWPDMQLFRRLVENYARRTLSYPCDSISAFSGVLNSLEGSFFAGFLFGLPELYFDIALLWQPYASLHDRKVLAELTGLPLQPLPTWSWCRWQGNINFEPWTAADECRVISR